jgi:hypothetical protein
MMLTLTSRKMLRIRFTALMAIAIVAGAWRILKKEAFKGRSSAIEPGL